MDLGPHQRVEFLSRQARAQIALATAIAETVPSRLELTRKGGQILRPGDAGYGAALAQFKKEVSSVSAVQLLTFLYNMHQYFGSDYELFERVFSAQLTPRKLSIVRAEYPLLDQSTIAEIHGEMAASTVHNRLAALALIDLVDRRDCPRPRPKYVTINRRGLLVMDGAIDTAVAELAPAFASLAPRSCSPAQQSATEAPISRAGS